MKFNSTFLALLIFFPVCLLFGPNIVEKFAAGPKINFANDEDLETSIHYASRLKSSMMLKVQKERLIARAKCLHGAIQPTYREEVHELYIFDDLA